MQNRLANVSVVEADLMIGALTVINHWRYLSVSTIFGVFLLGFAGLKSAIATGRKMLREAESQLRLVPENKYRDALSGLVETLDRMIGQFAG